MQPSGNRTAKGQNSSNKLTSVLLIIYIIVLFWILLFKLGVQFSYMPNRRVNLVPFDRLFLPNGKVDKAELILNVVIFVPLGIYVGVLFKKRAWRHKLLIFALTSLMFEGLQFIFKIGAFDITDIITNTLGGLAGLLLFEVIEKLFNNEAKSQNFINAIATIGTLTMIALLLLLKLNMLPIRYQ